MWDAEITDDGLTCSATVLAPFLQTLDGDENYDYLQKNAHMPHTHKVDVQFMCVSVRYVSLSQIL